MIPTGRPLSLPEASCFFRWPSPPAICTPYLCAIPRSVHGAGSYGNLLSAVTLVEPAIDGDQAVPVVVLDLGEPKIAAIRFHASSADGFPPRDAVPRGAAPRRRPRAAEASAMH